MDEVFCDFRYKCLYESCCNLNIYQLELLEIHIFLTIIFMIISIITTFSIIKGNDYEFKDNDLDNTIYNNKTQFYKHVPVNEMNLSYDKKINFIKKNFISDNISQFNLVNAISNVFTKLFIIYLLISKIIELSIMQNYFTTDESYIVTDGYKTMYMILSFIIEFFLILYSFSIIDLSTQIIEFYKRYIFVIIIYTYLFFRYKSIAQTKYYNSYSMYNFNSYICLIIFCLQILLGIYASKIYFYKLSIIN